MANPRNALLASAATSLSLAGTPGALANNLFFTDSDPSNGIRRDVSGVYASGSSIYAATIYAPSSSTSAGSSWTNYTISNGLGDNRVYGVYASGSSIYAATELGLSMAQLPSLSNQPPSPSNPVPGPLPVLGVVSAFSVSRGLRPSAEGRRRRLPQLLNPTTTPRLQRQGRERVLPRDRGIATARHTQRLALAPAQPRPLLLLAMIY